MPRNTKTEIQSIIFDLRNWNEFGAIKWLSEHGFFPSKKAHYTKNFIRFRLRNPNKYDRLRTRKMNSGISFVIGFID